MVWRGVSVFGIIGPHFFEEGNCTVTVTSARYWAMLDTLDVDADGVDGELLVSASRCHSIHSTLVTGLCESYVFWTRHSTFEWYRLSCQVFVPLCDYFLWGHLKAEVYTNEPRTLEESKEHVMEEIRAIDKGLLQAVMVISGHSYGNVLLTWENNERHVIFKE